MRVIAIDGPAASGKSSTAAAVARNLGWAHLDSGALYRALTLAALDHLSEGWGTQQLIGLAEQLPVRLVLVDRTFRPEVAGVDVAEAIRSDRVTGRVSEVAALPEVRRWVNTRQRDAAAQSDGVVVDGRDIGSVVFPDAALKIFLTATPTERARRRLAQRGGRVNPEELEREAQMLAARDHADSTRSVAPLRPAADAVMLDTTQLSLDEQVARVVAMAQARLPG